MQTLTVKISRLSDKFLDIPLPKYATEGSAGMDICAAVENELIIASGSTVLVPTDFSIELPVGYEAQIRPRSGLAIKYNIGIMNSPGTIDSDYRGEVKILLTNFGNESFSVKRGDRIAQMVISSYTRVAWNETDELSKTVRGEGGFGHTGINHKT
ncbi:MAG: dUTP diphosphatase [Bacteroidetes bacterium]|nr:dUTP diphosphatase [Bacteroidota bacterium]